MAKGVSPGKTTENWWRLTAAAVAARLKTDPGQGLAPGEARRRLEHYGENRLVTRGGPGALALFLAQFKDVMVLVLLGATVLSFHVGEIADAFTILAIVTLNAILGFIQEYRAERSLAALREMASPVARVIRGGQETVVPAREVVPGDLIVLREGDKVPADARLVAVQGLEVDEATFTGESEPVAKQGAPLAEEVALGERTNMVWMSTLVTRGEGRGIVVGTGMATELGRIAHLMSSGQAEPTPLERRLRQLGKTLVGGCLGICILVVLVGLWRGEELRLMIMAGISLAVAAIPEGLPAAVTVALALGVQRMSKRRAIVRRLPAVETLGCVSTICADKTGTLTENAMTVTRVVVAGGEYEVTGTGARPQGAFRRGGRLVDPLREPELRLALEIGALCNHAELAREGRGLGNLWRGWRSRPGEAGRQRWQILGDPTEGALLVAGAKAGLWPAELKETEGLSLVGEIPFSSTRKRMTSFYRVARGKEGENSRKARRTGGRIRAYTKGAADVVLGLCTHFSLQGQVFPLTPMRRREFLAAQDRLADQGLRVLALAWREWPIAPAEHGEGRGEGAEERREALERELVFVGLVGLQDPPRATAREAIKLAARAGIRTVMITGDHLRTALAVGRQLELVGQEPAPGEALTGKELETMSEEELARVAPRARIFARVTPEHKLRIVRALRRHGAIVAMTGDGVNDAPALREADIGVAMGRKGTDVAKEAAAMVLTDDNYATIVAAVEEGRAIYANIRKFIRYLLGCNIGEVLTMFLATLFGLPLPLLPLQILWMNLVTDGLPALALGVDPAEEDLMKLPPRPAGAGIFADRLGVKIASQGVLISLCTLATFIIGLALSDWDQVRARSLAFTTLVFAQLAYAFHCRSERHSLWETGLSGNRYLMGAVAVSLTMQLAVLYLPFFQNLFQTVPLSAAEWLLVLFFGNWSTLLVDWLRGLRWRLRRRFALLRA